MSEEIRNEAAAAAEEVNQLGQLVGNLARALVHAVDE